MAEHKVPQDVEAEDKLLGPFSFRQFIYLMIALSAIAMAYFLGRMLIFLALIPAPVAIVFLILALPLRKDQPMETYIGALIHFYLSPSRRIWNPDGQDVLVEITNPPIDSVIFTKEIGGAEAAQRLSFLAEVEDTQGWSTRGVTGSMINTTNLADDFASAALDAPDILDSNDSTVQYIDNRINYTEQQRREQLLSQFNSTVPSPAAAQPQAKSSQPAGGIDEHALAAALRQSSAQARSTFQQDVVQPIGTLQPPKAIVARPAPQPVATPSPNIASPFLPSNNTTLREETKSTEPAKIETVSATIEPTPIQSAEEVIGHNGGSNSEEIEVKLH